VAGRVQLMDSEHTVRKMFYNTIGGRIPLGKPKRRWIAEAEENSRKVLSPDIGKRSYQYTKCGGATYRRSRRSTCLLRHSTRKQRVTHCLLLHSQQTRYMCRCSSVSLCEVKLCEYESLTSQQLLS